MQSTQILKQEHDAVLVVLDQLAKAVAAAEGGAPVPADIFRDIQEFFTVFVDQCHHGKEEAAVFNELGSGTGRQVTRSLTDEHAQGRKLAAHYSSAVASYEPGDVQSAHRLADAANAYDVMLRQHIDEENTELFPLMEQSLAMRDADITAEFDRIEMEELGEGTHERLHAMIDTLPARIAPWVSPSDRGA
ncbi:MAG: hemerythrin domain-containing protein [Nitrolancea sp.]